jgi:hypothetical protein
LLVRLACFAAVGKFHFAENNISIALRVSDLISFEKPYRLKNLPEDFFRPKMGLKVNFGFRVDLHRQACLHPELHEYILARS